MINRIIRRGCWETNSSSTHSISLASEDKQFILDTIYPDQDGIIKLTGGEFGWEWFKYNDALTKANYAAQDLGDNEILIDVIKEQTGAKDVILDIEDGYIDHESVGLVPRDKDGLRNFIFNKNSFLFGGNDNTTARPDFYDVPEIRDGKIYNVKYKYKLTIDGLNDSVSFKKKPTNEEIGNAVDSMMSSILMDEIGNFVDPEVTTSIDFQINRNRNYFEKSYMVQQNYSEGYIIMTKENSIYEIEKELERNGKYEGLNWDQKSKLLSKKVLEDKNISRKVNFIITKI